MSTRRTALAIAFAFFVTTTSLAWAADKTVILEIGTKGMTVMLERPFKAVLIGDPSVVDVFTQSDRWAMLQPQSLGKTNIIFVDEENIVIANFRVVVCETGAKTISLSDQPNCDQADAGRKSPM